MTALLYAIGVLLFALAIVASIALHELGHMIPAKRFGAKVTQYFVGFGPTVWSRRRGETEYGVKAVPLGGYIKIVGMLPPEPGRQVPAAAGGERVRGSSTGLFTQLISDARTAEWELVGPADADRLFYKLPWWKKVIVMAGGPSVNILIAFVIFAGVFATYGNPGDVRVSPVIAEVSDCVVEYAQSDRACTPADPVAPARAAGLEPGDEIVSFNGTAVTGWQQLSGLIRSNDNGTAEIGFVRDGEQLLTTTNTTVALRPTSATDETLRQVGFLGVQPTVELATGGPLYSLRQMGSMTVETVVALATLPAKVWDVGLAIAGVQERDPEGPVSIVGGGRIAGETTSTPVFDVVEKTAFLLLIIAGFNFFIGMFNFVPLLPLDGGHIAGALFEGARRGVARVRGRPDPGYVDVARLLPVAYVTAGVFLVMGLVLIVGDVLVPVDLPF